MKMSLGEQIIMLLTHRDNINGAKTFDELKDHQVAFVDLLLADMEAEDSLRRAQDAFLDRNAPVVVNKELSWEEHIERLRNSLDATNIEASEELIAAIQAVYPTWVHHIKPEPKR